MMQLAVTQADILFIRGADLFAKGREAEAAGDLDAAVKFYKLAEKAGHDLEEDNEGSYIEEEDIDDEEYESRQIQEGEEEDTCRLTPEEEERFKTYPNALDYKLSEEDKVRVLMTVLSLFLIMALSSRPFWMKMDTLL